MPQHLRTLHSYCQRYYAIQRWIPPMTGWCEIEKIDSELCEVAAMKYMHDKYPNAEVRLVQKIISEITYEVK